MLQWIAALVLFVLSFALQACAQAGASLQSQPERIQETAVGAPPEGPRNDFCRIVPIGASDWKVYSEGQKQPLLITAQSLKQEVEPMVSEALRQAGVNNKEPSAYQLYLRCSQAAPALVFDFDQGDSKACVVYTPQTKSSSVYSNNEASDSPCTGENPQTLLIGLDDPNLLGAATDILRTHYPDVLEDLKSDQGVQLLLKLKEKYRFRESEAKARLESDSDFMSRVEYLDYDRVDGLLGESTPLVASSL